MKTDTQTSHIRRDFSQDAYSTAWIKEDGPCSVDLFNYALGDKLALPFQDASQGADASLLETNLPAANVIDAFLGEDEICYNVSAIRYLVTGSDNLPALATMSIVVGDGTILPLGPLRLFAHNSSLGMTEGVFTFSDRVIAIPAMQSFRVQVEFHGFRGARSSSITVQLLRDHAPAALPTMRQSIVKSLFEAIQGSVRRMPDPDVSPASA